MGKHFGKDSVNLGGSSDLGLKNQIEHNIYSTIKEQSKYFLCRVSGPLDLRLLQRKYFDFLNIRVNFVINLVFMTKI